MPGIVGFFVPNDDKVDWLDTLGVTGSSPVAPIRPKAFRRSTFRLPSRVRTCGTGTQKARNIAPRYVLYAEFRWSFAIHLIRKPTRYRRDSYGQGAINLQDCPLGAIGERLH
jgi:hypothetical protein